MKRVLNSRHFHRSLGLIAALVLIAAVIFVFTRPLLAPELGVNELKNDSDSANIETGATFDSTVDSGKIGEKVKADSFLIFDEKTGKVIAERNPDSAVAIASITKLMTAYVTQKYGSLEDTWAVTSAGVIDIKPVLGLAVGDRVKISDLVNAMLVGSANDAASSLGTYIASIKKMPAAEVMNKEAVALGMNSTHYENPIGFDSEQNYSTANDLKKLLDAIRPIALFSANDRKESYSFTGETGKTYSVQTTNKLLASDSEIHAIKTGYTDEAKGAMITSIHHGDMQFVIIVLASPNREDDTKLLKSQVLSTLNN
ncbi:MAG TPA: serine hydrolase [Patescibacteria group bacterium]|jgi:D-alanyl-D-alanine carboxypeptidase (penicillin-binding protein 5/6)|nr:serine hydrolase [Patescibacteria group bacterium]